MLFYHLLLSAMLIFSKPHTNACVECDLVHDCKCYNISRGMWCASKGVPTDVAMNLLTMRHCVYKAILSTAVSAWKTKGTRSRYLLFWMYPSAQLQCSVHLYALIVMHVHSSLATSCTFCNQLTHTHVIWHFVFLLYSYAKQGMDPNSPIGRQYNE